MPRRNVEHAIGWPRIVPASARPIALDELYGKQRCGAYLSIVDMQNAMRRAGYAEQTIDHAYTVGKTAFGYARKWRKIMVNPFDDVDPPSVKTVDPTPLSEAEAAALRWAVEDHRLRALYELALILGPRKGELLGLTIEGLDLKAATITISQQVLDLDDGPSIEPYTKNDEPRTLPLTPRLLALMSRAPCR